MAKPRHDHSHRMADPPDQHHVRGHFATRVGFILAAVGSAVGLGNIWKFPYVMGENGGAAFLLVYLGCILLVGLPVLLAEFVIGRAGETSAVGSYRKLARGPWWLNGLLGVAAGFFILSFYSAVAGWVLRYFVNGTVSGFAAYAGDASAERFVGLISSAGEPIVYQFLVMAMTAGILFFGIEKGIERAARFLMPLLFLILLLLLVRSLTLPGAMEGLAFMFQPDFGKLSWKSVLEALGHSFFTLSIGMGVMITYASYVDRDVHLGKTAGTVATLDTGIALLAGMVIFPAVFAFGMEPGTGPALMFITLPQVFAQMPLGHVVGAAFFFLVFIAALTSTISILEPVVTWLVDDMDLTRWVASAVAGGLIFVVGIPATLSVSEGGLLHGFTLPFLGGPVTIFDFLDNVSSKFMLPIGGLVACLFIVFAWGRKNAMAEVTGTDGDNASPFAKLWFWTVATVAPAGIIVILVAAVIELASK